MDGFLQQWGYLGVFLGILATGLGFPMPEELPVVIGGALAAGKQVTFWMLPVCIVGVVIGDSFLYFIGRLWGARLVDASFFKKHVLSPEKMGKIRENFQNYGIRILLIARMTPGIRAPIFLTAGITRLSLTRFLIADGIYAIPGVSVLFFLGYYFTDSMVGLIENEASKVKSIIILVVVVGVTGYFLYRFLRRPMVTGDPADVPRVVEPFEHGYDQVTARITHPQAKDSNRAADTDPDLRLDQTKPSADGAMAPPPTGVEEQRR